MYINKLRHRTLRSVLVIGAAACFLSGAVDTESAMAAANTAMVQTRNAAVVSEYSIQPIAGTWREAGVADARNLVIYADGSYEMTCKERKAFGKVKVTAEEHPDGSDRPFLRA